MICSHDFLISDMKAMERMTRHHRFECASFYGEKLFRLTGWDVTLPDPMQSSLSYVPSRPFMFVLSLFVCVSSMQAVKMMRTLSLSVILSPHNTATSSIWSLNTHKPTK